MVKFRLLYTIICIQVRHCTLGSCTPSSLYDWFWLCVVLVLNVGCYCYWDFRCHPINFDLHIWAFLTKEVWLCGCTSSCLRIFSLNFGFNMLPSYSFVSYLDSLLGYITGEFQALELIVLVVFGAMV